MGLPGAGKSTWAKEQVKNSGGKVKRVNNDDLRNSIDAGIWSKSNEKSISEIRDTLLCYYLEQDKTVVIDNVNLHPKYIPHYKAIAKKYNAEFEVKFFDTPLEKCIKRDSLRPNPVGKRVIMQMYNQYLKPEPPKYNPDLPDCTIVDIDGTLALNNGRSPFDETKVIEDIPNTPVIELVKLWRLHNNSKNKLFIFSGRTDSCKEDTLMWLDKHFDFHYQNGYELHMRKTGDNRSDDIIKRELYEEFVKDKYNVSMVFDDRLRVCRLWYSLGLFVFNVNQGLIEF